jgi:quinol monooxygenase YgiN
LLVHLPNILLSTPTGTIGRTAGRRSGTLLRVPALPWTGLVEPDPEGEYLVVLTYLPLTRLSRLPAFLRYVRRIRGQLAGTEGLVGYSLLARPLRSRYWTLSVWRDRAALDDFVRRPPHRDAMAELPRALQGFRTTVWSASGGAVPPSWDDALARQE